LPLYQQALALGPGDPTLALEAAPLEADAGQFAEAIAHYEQALSAGARSPGVLNSLAYAYAEHGQRLERALELALEAQRQLPDSLEVADTLGWVQLRRGDHVQALPQLQRAAQGLPKQPNVAYHLGLAELAAGHADAGRRALQRCLVLRPEDELGRAARHALASAAPRLGRGAPRTL
jgi:tetratricopeptide (TPR) repeat protein